MAEESTFPLLLDVDTGVDDALALALAVQSPTAHIVGVSTVAGNCPIGAATENTRRVLSWCGAGDVPVFRGASRPLVAAHQDAAHIHGGNGLGDVELPPADRAIGVLPGPGALIQLAQAHAGELVVVALGPLTNLAIALNVRPELAAWLRALVVMGGAYAVPGNVTPVAEFNIYADPHAAAQVFAAPWRSIVAVGLDVTHQTALSRESWHRIADDQGETAGLVRRILARTFTERNMTGMYLHDPLAVGVALDPTLVTTARGRVEVDLDGETRGRTRLHEGGGVEVASTVRSSEFTRLFSERLGLPAADLTSGLKRAD